MKKLQFMAWPKLCSMLLLGAGALFVVSCATDGYDNDEKWESSVNNTQMTSPAADAIEIIPSADGMSMTIKWPVSMGAGGYQLNLLDVSDPANPVTILSRRVDGCSVESVPREEDVKYRLEVRTLGNAQQGNTDAPTTTVKEFSTTTPTTATIPAGSDLVEWFTSNPIPASEEMLYYDLVAGGSYTLNTQLNLAGHKVTLRSQSKNNRPNVTLGAEGGLVIDEGFGLKYIVFNCDATTKDFLSTSDAPTTTPDTKGFYIIEDPVTIQYCTINNVQNHLVGGPKVADDKRVCIKTFLINNCIVKLNTNDKLASTAIINMYTNRGFINSLSIQNSTIYNTTANDAKYFVQYENNMSCNQLADKLANSYVTFLNNTFYNIAKANQMANWSGIGNKGVTIYNIKSNIFVNCGNKQVARRIIVGKNNAEMNFNYNTYFFDNENVSSAESQYDTGTILTTDPGFADAANGDFTISGADQLAEQTGDPRWIN